MVRSVLSLLLVAGLTSCSDDFTILDSLRDTPVAIVVGTDTITIDADANRDFQPPNSVTGDSLDASVYLLGTNLPFAVTQIWVVQENDIWRAAPDSVGGGRWVVRGGPMWAPGTEVYLVAELTLTGAPPIRVRSSLVTITSSS